MEQRKPEVGHLSDKIERRGLMRALDSAQSLVWFDARGIIVDANANALEMFNYANDDILNADYGQLCGTTQANILHEKREWARILSDEIQHTERGYKRRDGAEVWAAVNFSVLRNPDGTPRRVVAIFVDMSRFAWKPNKISRVF